MGSSPFRLPFDKLPAMLPIFPLANAVVMPGCQLPLNIFEPRYITMVFDALGAARLIGMVQPDSGTEAELDHPPPVYRTGTAGRITSFSETQDGRLLVVLSGVCRFDIREEVPCDRGYRRVLVDWSRFRADLEPTASAAVDRNRLAALLKNYFERKGVETNWTAINQMPLPILLNVLTGQLPLDPPERQVLVEAVTVEARAARLCELLRFDVAGTVVSDSTRH